MINQLKNDLEGSGHDLIKVLTKYFPIKQKNH
jgi:hypothetical protein